MKVDIFSLVHTTELVMNSNSSVSPRWIADLEKRLDRGNYIVLQFPRISRQRLARSRSLTSSKSNPQLTDTNQATG